MRGLEEKGLGLGSEEFWSGSSGLMEEGEGAQV